jgi:hypothetical protein
MRRGRMRKARREDKEAVDRLRTLGNANMRLLGFYRRCGGATGSSKGWRQQLWKARAACMLRMLVSEADACILLHPNNKR